MSLLVLRSLGYALAALLAAGCASAPSVDLSKCQVIYHTGRGSSEDQSPFMIFYASHPEKLNGAMVKVKASKDAELRLNPSKDTGSSSQSILLSEEDMKILIEYLEEHLGRLPQQGGGAPAPSDIPRKIELHKPGGGFSVDKYLLDLSGQSAFVQAERVLLALNRRPWGLP